MRRLFLAGVYGSALSLAMLSVPAFADVIHDPIPAVNGSYTPTNAGHPDFGFTASPGPQTGDYVIDILVPNNEDPNPAAVTFVITGTQGGATNTSLIGPITAALIHPTAWTNGDLDTFIGGGFTNSIDPSITGFYVYQADLGTNRVADSSPVAGPMTGWGPLLQ